jgi:site-specific DNA-methyltransferase (cytosine-N4-specific)
MKLKFKTELGKYYLGDSTELLDSKLGKSLKGKVQLIITSPPFPLNNKKSYGNLNGLEYKKWFSNLAPIFSDLLKEDGSVVIELGNAWEKNRPVQSLLHLESFIAFAKNKKANLSLCQQFICYNPSRLPSPAQWVTINHIRATDSYTHVWWFGKTDRPKADTKKVLRPNSNSMKSLLKRQSYNSGKRPSEHNISKGGFLVDNGGSIPQNFFELDSIDQKREVRLPNAFSFSNTKSNDSFLRACRENGITPHPARMPEGLISFFVQFLTSPGDIIFDPFAGINTT